MQTEHLQELIQLEHRYWWHVAKRQLVFSWLSTHLKPPGRVIEGGIGGGTNLLLLEQMGYRVTGLDILSESIEHARGLGLNDVYCHDLSQPWPVENGSQDMVILLDVLEHIEDSVTTLKNAAATLAADGRILLTVPAYPWLYGDWDKALGHFRRYTPGMLRHQADQAGLVVERLNHWNSFTLPAAVAVRLYQKWLPAERSPVFPRVNPLTNELLLRVAAVERWCGQRLSIPCGLSLVGVLRK
jgi:SAM-dependent methyltransferase